MQEESFREWEPPLVHKLVRQAHDVAARIKPNNTTTNIGTLSNSNGHAQAFHLPKWQWLWA
eukprot:12891703-Prorocentrum_lima.AAC.1